MSVSPRLTPAEGAENEKTPSEPAGSRSISSARRAQRRRISSVPRELSPNVGDGRGSGGSGLNLRSDDLDSVGELYTEDDFRQLVVTVETTPAFLGRLREFEDHRERRLV